MRENNTMRRWLQIGSLVLAVGTLLGLWLALVQTVEGGRGPSVEAPSDGCPIIPNTPYFTLAYGTVLLDGTDAPLGTVVEAKSPRGDVVGCFEVSTAGYYGAMYIYGEDVSANPPIPGMRDGETVAFRVNALEATASPTLIWHDDRELHEVSLSATSPAEQPDLAVQDFVAAPETAALNEPIVFTATIGNIGDGATTHSFYVDIYLDHVPTGCGDPGWDYAHVTTLEAGGTVDLTFTYPGFSTSGLHSFYVYVDSACQVSESNEGNNVDGPLRIEVVDVILPPVADFSASPRSGVAPLTVHFTDVSTGQVDSWLWHFGDGGTSMAENPTHIYTTADVYTVSLTVGGAGGSDTLARTNYITAYASVQAAFEASPLSGTAPLTVHFTNLSGGDYTASLWHFGDGLTSAEEHPTHIYTAVDVYTVSLTVSGPGGTDTLTRPHHITVTLAPAVQANFTAWPTSGVAPLTVVFANTSGGAYTTSLWVFGDDTTSTTQHPTHTYTVADVYTVSLTVSGAGGTDTLTRPHCITVTLAPTVEANFTAWPTSGVVPLTVVFTNTSTGTNTTSLWSFGDGVTSPLPSPTHIYTLAGFYTVSLVVSGPGGSDVEEKGEYITVARQGYRIYLPLVTMARQGYRIYLPLVVRKL